VPLRLSLDDAGISWSTRCELNASLIITLDSSSDNPGIFTSAGPRVVNNVKYSVIKLSPTWPDHAGKRLKGEIVI
jgi:hypothetical protein